MRHFKNIHIGSSTIVRTGVSMELKTPTPVKVEFDLTNEATTSEAISWGSSNILPQDFYNKKFLKNGAAVGGISILKATMYGNGFSIFKKEKNETTGDIEIKEQLFESYPKLKQFYINNKLDKFFFAKITDICLYEIAFTEHCLSGDWSEIVRTKRHQAAHCRFSKPENGEVKYIFINTDWSTGSKTKTAYVRFLDRDALTVDEMKEIVKKEKLNSFMTISRLPLVDENFYPKADWHAVDRSGWIDVANSVPELKKYLFENQLHFKYMIYVSDFYFESFYKDEWDKFDADKRQEMRETLATTIDDHFKGNQASARSLVAPIFDESGKPVKGIEIVPIDDKLKDGSYLPDASAANSEILFAMCVNPAVIGAGTPGGSNLGGSGSNIREAYTVLSASLAPKRVYITDDFDLWNQWNNWDLSLFGAFPSVNLTTLDKNPNGQQTILNK